MENYCKIPPIYWEYMNTPAYYFTYSGNIYIGTLAEAPNYEKGFFIIPDYDTKFKLFQLNNNENNYEEFKKSGWEINDYRVIKKDYTFFQRSTIIQ